MQHPTTKRPKPGRYSAVTLIVALIAGVTVACAPATPGGGSSNQQFCEFFDKVEEKIAEAPPEVPDSAVLDDDAVLVKDEVGRCRRGDHRHRAGVHRLRSQGRARRRGAGRGRGGPSEAGQRSLRAGRRGDRGRDRSRAPRCSRTCGSRRWPPRSAPPASPSAATSRSSLSGQTSTIGFAGTLANLNNWSVTLSSSALTIPGITILPGDVLGHARRPRTAFRRCR